MFEAFMPRLVARQHRERSDPATDPLPDGAIRIHRPEGSTVAQVEKQSRHWWFFALLDDQANVLEVCGYLYFGSGAMMLPTANERMMHDAAAGRPGTAHVLQGTVARYLYTAITGKYRDDHPNDASAEKAIAARYRLADLPETDAQVLALRAIEQFGPYYWPWHGTTKLQDSGALIHEDPDYTRLFPFEDEIPTLLPQTSAWEQIEV
jgi:hypothetical protein